MYPQWQNPYMAAQMMAQQAYQMPQQSQQPRTVEVVPVGSEQAVVDFPVAIGVTQMFVAADDSFVAFKSNGVNGQSSLIFYDKRPPAPAATAPVYMTKEDVEAMISAAIGKAASE